MSEAARETDAILVVRLGAMGDILHALPAATTLKLSFPNRKLTWIVDEVWTPLLDSNRYIDRVVSFKRHDSSTWLPARRELRAWDYSMAVDFQGLIKSAVVARLSGARNIFGFTRGEVREGPAALLYTHRIASRSLHRVDRALDLARAAGAMNFTQESPLPPGESEGDLPEKPFVLASPLAGWMSKQWPLEYFDQLAAIVQREAGLPVVLNGAPSARNLLASAPNAQPHLSSISGLIDATRRARAVIGVDSGPHHLAAALRKPGVAIYGPTDPAINGPYGGTLRVLRMDGAPTTYKREPVIAPSMRAITPEQVWRALEPLL
jgi:heptosyltransferase-1